MPGGKLIEIGRGLAWSEDALHLTIDLEDGSGVVLFGAGAPSGGLGVDGFLYLDTAAPAIYGPKTSGAWGSPTSLVGPAGATGATGSTGSTGAAGADGKTVRTGTGAPGGGLGVDGDFYIDTAASTIYGPKASGSWGSANSLVGPTGATGAAGSTGATGATGSTGAAGADGKTVRNGTGAPSGGLGVDGDFYIDTAAATIYGPKTSGSWGSATSLVGPTGATGAAGSTGATGSTGSTGAAGADGKTVRNGTGAPGGGLGVDGDFYIDTAASAIYGPKAGGSWGSATSLVGATGATGSTGSTGSAGADGKTVRNGSGAPSGGLGVDGDFYIDTTAHAVYGPKASGAWGSATSLVGPTGSTGATGSTGSTGSAGADGKTVRNGSGAPSGGLGVDGDFYIDTTALVVYGPKASGSWGSGTSLSGVAGINDQTGTTYTLVLGDAGKDVRSNNASAITLTVPPNSSVAFVVGTMVAFSQKGAGGVTASPGAGVTLRAANGAATSAQYDARVIEKIDTDEWRVW